LRFARKRGAARRGAKNDPTFMAGALGTIARA
jgi:hypothetical protein